MEKFMIIVIVMMANLTQAYALTPLQIFTKAGGDDATLKAFLAKPDCSLKQSMIGRCGTVYADTDPPPDIYSKCVEAVKAVKCGDSLEWCPYAQKWVKKGACKPCPQNTTEVVLEALSKQPICGFGENPWIIVKEPADPSAMLDRLQATPAHSQKEECTGFHWIFIVISFVVGAALIGAFILLYNKFKKK